MALTGVKFDSDSGGFVSNCFPVRGLVRRDINEGLLSIFFVVRPNDVAGKGANSHKVYFMFVCHVCILVQFSLN